MQLRSRVVQAWFKSWRAPAATTRVVSITISLALMVAIGCGDSPPVVSKPLPSAVKSHKKKRLDPKLLKAEVGDGPNDPYRVGPGDSLLVAVYGHPDLSLTQYGGGGGRLIDNDGTIQFPLIGSVKVSGKSVNELRLYLEEELRAFLQNPKVTVQVMNAGSIRYYMLGQFTSPGMKSSDRPLRLLEAMSLGGSVDLDSASLRSAYVARGKRRLPVNFLRLMMDGDMDQNIMLRRGDVVFVPSSSSDRVFVFGGITGERSGGSVPFINGRLGILQALAQAGFGFQERAQGVLSDTRVIRSEGDRGELFVVDVERILDGKAANFHLAPGDVIFVPTSTITDWNLAVRQLLPTMQAVSGTLNPFVQIEFLRSSRLR